MLVVVLEIVVIMDIFLCRHGETDWSEIKRLQGRKDIPLNSRGVKTSQKLGEFFLSKNLSYTKIVASNLLRSRKTAEIISEFLNLEIECDERIIERDFGVASGYLFSEVEKHLSSGNVKNLESRMSLVKRIISFWEELICNSDENCSVIVVTHSLVIAELMYLLGSSYDLDNPQKTHNTVYHVQVTKLNLKISEYSLE